MRHALLFVALLLMIGCSEDRGRGGVRIIADAGGFLDAGPNGVRDSGAGVVRDGGPGAVRDGGPGAVRDGGPGAVRDGGPGAVRDGGVAAIPLAVQDLQDPTRPNWPGPDAVVRLDNVVVTSMFTFGDQMGSFHVQMPNGGPFSGILVFVPTSVIAPTVAIGDRVTLTGKLKEFFDVTEVEFQTLVSRTPGAPLVPELVTPDALATGAPTAESWEGVLVRVSNVQVINSNPDFPNDFGEFQVTGGLRIDDGLYRLDPRPPEFSSVEFIIGVHHHAFAEYKLMPRTAADIGQIF